MAEKVYTCRACHQPFTGKDEEMGITWYYRSRGYAYHMDCWKKLTSIHNDKNADEWFDLIFDLITRELHEDYDYFKIKTQAQSFISKYNYTMKGIYFTLHWFFLVEKKEYKKEYGIGIIPHIYHKATQYWLEQERKQEGIMAEIEKLKKIEAAEAKVINVKTTREKKKRSAAPVLD